MVARGSVGARETLEERWLLEAQTARNLEALAAEQAGDVERAIGLYERNVAEGFAGDLPYGRLVMLYERRGALEEAERVLRRAIEVLEASRRRTAADRRATVRVFKNRLKLLLKARARATRPEAESTSVRRVRSS
jgi:tetratricopeptide (TPR) repeat protein